MAEVGVALAISAATAAATSYVSYEQARQQNEAMKKSKATSKRIYETRTDALKKRRASAIKNTLEKRDTAVLRNTETAAKARGQIKVRTAGAGLSTGSGAGLALLEDVNQQSRMNEYMLKENVGNALEGIQSGFEANSIEAMASFEQQMNAANAQMQNEFLAGFGGFAGGAGTGLQIYGGLRDANNGNPLTGTA